MSSSHFPDMDGEGDYFPGDRQDRSWAPGLASAGDAKSALYRCNFVVALRREFTMLDMEYGSIERNYVGRSISAGIAIDTGGTQVLDLDADAIAAQRVVRAITERPDARIVGDLVFSTVYRYLRKAMELQPYEVLRSNTNVLQSFMDLAAEEVGGTAVQIDARGTVQIDARGSHIRRDAVELRVVIRVDEP